MNSFIEGYIHLSYLCFHVTALINNIAFGISSCEPAAGIKFLHQCNNVLTKPKLMERS